LYRFDERRAYQVQQNLSRWIWTIKVTEVSSMLCSLEKQLLSNGVRYQVEVYDTKTARGWGVRALEPIPPDQPVMEYVGQVIKRAETERREKLYSDEGRQVRTEARRKHSDLYPGA